MGDINTTESIRPQYKNTHARLVHRNVPKNNTRQQCFTQMWKITPSIHRQRVSKTNRTKSNCENMFPCRHYGFLEKSEARAGGAGGAGGSRHRIKFGAINRRTKCGTINRRIKFSATKRRIKFATIKHRIKLQRNQRPAKEVCEIKGAQKQSSTQ